MNAWTEHVISAILRLGVNPDLVRPGARLTADLGIDSTEAVELVTELKRRTHVAIPSRWCKGKTIDDLATYLEEQARTCGA